MSKISNKKWRLGLIVLCLLFQSSLFAQGEATDFGMNLGVDFSKKFGKKFEIGIGEEFRTKNNVSEVDRFMTSATVSYSPIRKYLKLGAGYVFIANWQDVEEYYSLRHRFYGQASTKYDLDRFTFGLRSRYQHTWLDESEKRYKWNPRCYWRNKLNVSYKVPKIHLSPFISGELFYQTNHYKGNVIDAYRLEGGLKYDFDRRNSLELAVRYDEDINVKAPTSKISVGLFYSYSF